MKAASMQCLNSAPCAFFISFKKKCQFISDYFCRKIDVACKGKCCMVVFLIVKFAWNFTFQIPFHFQVNIEGFTPSFTTAFCKSTRLFLVGINDVKNPRILAVDLSTRKVKGVIHVNGILIDNIECDNEGNGFAYVFQIGTHHNVIQVCISFSTQGVM